MTTKTLSSSVKIPLFSNLTYTESNDKTTKCEIEERLKLAALLYEDILVERGIYRMDFHQSGNITLQSHFCDADCLCGYDDLPNLVAFPENPAALDGVVGQFEYSSEDLMTIAINNKLKFIQGYTISTYERYYGRSMAKMWLEDICLDRKLPEVDYRYLYFRFADAAAQSRDGIDMLCGGIPHSCREAQEVYRVKPTRIQTCMIPFPDLAQVTWDAVCEARNDGCVHKFADIQAEFIEKRSKCNAVGEEDYSAFFGYVADTLLRYGSLKRLAVPTLLGIIFGPIGEAVSTLLATRDYLVQRKSWANIWARIWKSASK